MNNSAINIVICSDNNYAIPMYISITSLLESKNKETVYQLFLLVSDDFSKSIMNDIDRVLVSYGCPVAKWISMNGKYENTEMVLRHITPATYYRLMIPEFVSESKCIYIDVDVCVCDDLSAMYETDLSDSYMAGVMAAAFYDSEQKRKELAKVLGIAEFDRYVNAGVLLMNLDRLRKDNLSSKFENLIPKNFFTQDQDILNSACYPDIRIISPRFNSMTKNLEDIADFDNKPYLGICYQRAEWEESLTNPAIIHYADARKPWMYPDAPFADRWWNAFYSAQKYITDKSAWSDNLIRFFILTQRRHELNENNIQREVNSRDTRIGILNKEIDNIRNSKRYRVGNVILAAPALFIRAIKNISLKTASRIYGVHGKLSRKIQNKITVFDVAMDSDNLGDEIIMKYSMKILNDMFPSSEFVHIPTHRVPTDEELRRMHGSKYKFICGTNIITPDIEKYSLMKYPQDMSEYTDIILMAAGWNHYSDGMTDKSKQLYSRMFSKRYSLSLRDSYSTDMMKKSGFANSVNTNCLTLWDMTPEKCCNIPKKKATDAVFTLTAHRSDIIRDRKMVDVLLENYEKVYFWPQGDKDLAYFESLNLSRNIVVLKSSLAAYEELLNSTDTDYIGTRLHGGIHALNLGHRALIVIVDNRAAEISRDTNLPVIRSEDVLSRLSDVLCRETETNLNLNFSAINAWKAQFTK